MRKTSSRPTSGEYRFRIDAFTPATMPMARLAEYMRELAQVLGEPASVHFERIEAGSTVVVHRVEREAIPKVVERTAAVERGDAPRDATRAFHSINKLLQEDNGTARLTKGRSRTAVVLQFPGAETPDDGIPSVRQHGSVDGIIVRIGGSDETVPILLEVEEGRQISGCNADRATAKRLAPHLFDPVRLFGRGRWNRERGGDWRLVDFRVESFEVLSDKSLREALARVRAVGGVDPKAYRDLDLIRHGDRKRGRD